MKQKILARMSMVLLLLSLTACGSRPEMPMEITVDGYNIVLGKTTMQDLIDQGYDINSNGRQDVAHDGDKYIAFDYSVDQGAGHQFWVTVCVPWSGNADISAEQSGSATEGIIRTVNVKQSAAEKITVTYNGVNLSDMTFDTAVEWGAKEDTEKSTKTYKMTASQGFLTWEARNTSDDSFNELRVQMSQSEFEEMQK